jgi:hypothetical protein
MSHFGYLGFHARTLSSGKDDGSDFHICSSKIVGVLIEGIGKIPTMLLNFPQFKQNKHRMEIAWLRSS